MLANIFSKDKNNQNVKNDEKNNVLEHKYPKPKILLIDLPEKAVDEIKSAGFNAVGGTFGNPYKIELSDGYCPVIYDFSLPNNYNEQEVIIIDLTPPETINGPRGNKKVSKGELDFWTKCSRGKVDPRPCAIFQIEKSFERIFNHGGLFIVFAEPRIYQEIILGKVKRELYGERFVDKLDVYCDNWSFLSFLSKKNLEIEAYSGEEIIDYRNMVPRNLRGGKYTAIFKRFGYAEMKFEPFLFNKFEDCIGGLITHKNCKGKGKVLILPQILEKSEIIIYLLNNFLPEISPHLFPHMKNYQWIERDEYELDSVRNLKKEIEEIQLKTEKEIKEIEQKIMKEREIFNFLKGILTKTGNELVLDIKSCFEFIEFKKIINMDEEIKQSNKVNQEDLQIHDKLPILLIEVKGLSGFPTEDDILQVVKYVPRRMMEWNITDVRGVSIINHQRNIPAIERDEENVFTKQQIEDAELNKFTILTTWDLFLLINGMIKWNWNPQSIRELFYKSGRLSRIPIIYKPVGKIVKYFEKSEVISVEVTEHKLHKGQYIGYVISEGYLEEQASSLQIDKQEVEEAVCGDKVGIKTKYPKEYLKEGMIVYVIEQSENE